MKKAKRAKPNTREADLKAVHAIISDRLHEFATLFVDGMKLTFIARLPNQPEMELLIGNDDLTELEALLNRMKARQPV